MPRITGPTVAEHRAAQYRALLDAAGKLITDSGGAVPTLTDVADAMGLARSSIYLYVGSRRELVVQLLLDVIPAWVGDLAAAMDAAGDRPVEKLTVYVDEALRLLLEDGHGPLMVAAHLVPDCFLDPAVQEAHGALVPIVESLLHDAGGPVAVASLPLIDAAIQRGAGLVSAGLVDEAIVRSGLHRMVHGLVSDGR